MAGASRCERTIIIAWNRVSEIGNSKIPQKGSDPDLTRKESALLAGQSKRGEHDKSRVMLHSLG